MSGEQKKKKKKTGATEEKEETGGTGEKKLRQTTEETATTERMWSLAAGAGRGIGAPLRVRQKQPGATKEKEETGGTGEKRLRQTTEETASKERNVSPGTGVPSEIKGSGEATMEIGAINRLTQKIIGSAIEVHRVLGPGLLESLYEAALCEELGRAGLKYKRELSVPVQYKGVTIGRQRIDLLVEDEVVVELKSVEKMDPVFEAQLASYLRVSGKRVGLLMNFNTTVLRKGIKRVMA